LARVRKIYGSSKRKTNHEQLKKAREEVSEELMNEFNLK